MKFSTYYQGDSLNPEELKRFNSFVKLKRLIKYVAYVVFTITMVFYIMYHLNILHL